LCPRAACGDREGGVYPCGGRRYNDVSAVHGTVFRLRGSPAGIFSQIAGISSQIASKVRCVARKTAAAIPTAERSESARADQELGSTTDRDTGAFVALEPRVRLKPQITIAANHLWLPWGSQTLELYHFAQ
jgi:hypothetical protein